MKVRLDKVRLDKIRLDRALVERGLVQSRERAQALILAGRVMVGGQKGEKPGAPVAQDAALRVLGEDMRYVSRGGLKLERALEHWGIRLDGRACLDVGASTGGFTDCMLQHGAVSVLAVDTGYGQIAHKLRVDARVRLMERCNARLLKRGELSVVSDQWSEKAEADSSAFDPALRDRTLRNDKQKRITFLAMDVSFISATLVLPAVLGALVAECEPENEGELAQQDRARWRGEAVVLIKPQFEAGREHVGKGGIVREEAARQLAIERVRGCVEGLSGEGIEVIESPITGAEGNVEYLLRAFFGGTKA
jgi:23S rRNA (cytidine1920-2'-O)/16S rRNA (cytidine1409-2'-O)-methyltransferase